MVPLIIQLISGAVGGNIAGAILKNFNLGPIGNSIAGLVGGGLGGHLLSMLTSGGGGLGNVGGGGFRVEHVFDFVQRGWWRCWRGHCDGDCWAD